MANIKFVQYGCGKMAKYTIRYALERGYEIVGAFDIDKSKFGTDAGEYAECAKTGVVIEDAAGAREKLAELRPNVVIITTMSFVNDLRDILLICAELGLNAITTCEEAFYPQNSNPALFKQIDELAKKNECTIAGSGYQDVFWGNLIATLAGATARITKIKGRTSYNVEDYGIALAKAHGAGLDLNQFEKEIAAADNISEAERKQLIDGGKFAPSYMWNTNGWLASRLGLHITKQTQKCVPQTHETELKSSTLEMVIPAGNATGMSAVVTSETEEGVIIESECIGKVYAPEEFDQNQWTIYGEPDTTVTIDRPATVELTCATIVNRMTDLIAAPAGYVTTEKMPQAHYIAPSNKLKNK